MNDVVHAQAVEETHRPASIDIGIHQMSATVYHADPCPKPSLSSSIAKMLCLGSALHAQHSHPRLNPAAIDDESESFDIGTAAHALLLEGHANIEVIDAKDWRTNAAKAARDAAREVGRLPLLARHWTTVQEMVASARAQLNAHLDGGAAMFTNGEAEQVLVWREGDTWCRARLDWFRRDSLTTYAIDDYKTTSATANPETWTRTLFGAGFDLQAAWYRRGLKALSGTDATFRFAVQETYPPYALSVIALGPDAMILAEKKCLYALEVWNKSLSSNEWPGYPRRTCYAALPMAHEAWWLERECR